MAIALDSQGKSTTGTFNFNNVAGNFMAIGVFGTGNQPSYNGVAATQVQSTSSGTGRQSMSLWIIKSPATGTNSLSITGTPTDIFVVTYSGCDTTTQPDNSALNTGSGTGPITGTVTVNTANSWLFAVTADATGGETAGTGTTFRQTDTGNGVISCDSNGALSTGSHSLQVNYSGTTTSWAAITIAIKPAAAAANGNFLAFM